MKRAILSPICSALIIPGFGQILNRNIKKGLTLLGLMFLILIAMFVKLIQMILGVIDITDTNDPVLIMEKIRVQDSSFIQILVIIFGIVWLYSIIDATLEGIKIDKRKES